MGAFACGVLYAVFHFFYGRKIDERMMVIFISLSLTSIKSALIVQKIEIE